MNRCAFLTMADPTGFHVYDEVVAEPLAKLGWRLDSIPWTRTDVDWAGYDAVVVRSTWDYQADPDAFLAALRAIESGGGPLRNDYATCQWNLNKGYLRELEAKNAAIVPSVWPDGFDADLYASLFDRWSTDRIAAKPLVGANADNIVLVSRDGTGLDQAESLYRDRPHFVQPFLDSIATEGEYSLIYFSGEFSHAVRKRPASGDFRVQEEHGGIITPFEPGRDLLGASRRVLDSFARTLLYARVDLARLADGSPVLMELELIEPSLYFPYGEGSPERFARHIAAMRP